MKHAWRVGEKYAIFSPDNMKHSGDLDLDVRIILKYVLAICEEGNIH
jgi:hypothetical protein